MRLRVVSAMACGVMLGAMAAVAVAADLPKLAVGRFHGIRPATIGFSGDGGNIVGEIHWRRWAARGAYGVGISDIQSCVPNCAQGKDTPVRTTLTLSRIRRGQFTEIVERRTGTRLVARKGTDTWPLYAGR